MTAAAVAEAAAATPAQQHHRPAHRWGWQPAEQRDTYDEWDLVWGGSHRCMCSGSSSCCSPLNTYSRQRAVGLRASGGSWCSSTTPLQAGRAGTQGRGRCQGEGAVVVGVAGAVPQRGGRAGGTPGVRARLLPAPRAVTPRRWRQERLEGSECCSSAGTCRRHLRAAPLQQRTAGPAASRGSGR